MTNTQGPNAFPDSIRLLAYQLAARWPRPPAGALCPLIGGYTLHADGRISEPGEAIVLPVTVTLTDTCRWRMTGRDVLRVLWAWIRRKPYEFTVTVRNAKTTATYQTMDWRPEPPADVPAEVTP